MFVSKELPEYDNTKGFQYLWEDDFSILVSENGGAVIIDANNEGLKSLAWHLLTLAQKDYPKGTHIHYDEYNSLENGSMELIINKS